MQKWRKWLYIGEKNEKLVFLWTRFRYVLSWCLDRGDKTRKKWLKLMEWKTLVSYQRLQHLWDLIKKLEKDEIPGNIVECGVWKGGSAGIMVYLNQSYGNKRQVHLFDSFAGMPEPTKKDGVKAAVFASNKVGGKQVAIGKTVGCLHEVKSFLFEELKLKRKNVFFHQGWFEKTLTKKKKSVGKIALLRIDADWYASVKVCLEELYNQVVNGGYIVFDDYGNWPGCKKAVDEFMRQKRIKSSLKKIDFSGVFFRK